MVPTSRAHFKSLSSFLLPCLWGTALLIGPPVLGGEEPAGDENSRFLSGSPDAARYLSGEAEGVYDEADVIRAAYDAAAHAIIESGHFVSFEIGDVRTYYPPDFRKVLVRDLMTIDPEYRLQITRMSVGTATRETVGTSFQPQWTGARHQGETPAERLQRRSKYDHYTLAVFEEMAAEQPGWEPQNVIAVTSCEVTVSFDDRTQTYRAAFKWIREGDTIRFNIEDHVTVPVEEAMLWNEPVAPFEVLQARGLAIDRRQESGVPADYE